MHKTVNGQQVPLTQAEIDARMAEEAAWQAERDAYIQNEKYKDDRKAEYPSIGDQLDALYHAMDRGLTIKVPEFYDPIKAVKDKYPKP